MADPSLASLLFIAVAFLLAGMVKGVTGMGLPTFAMALLGMVMPPVAAASLLIVPSFVTNVWQLLAGPSFRPLAGRLWPMLVAVMVGTVAGSWLIANGNIGWTTQALGAALVVYAAYTLLARQLRVPPRAERLLGPLVGATTGLVTGGTGVFVMPAVPYLQALGLTKDDLVQALGLSFTVSTVALAIGLIWHGAYRSDGFLASGLALVPALVGMWAGTWLRGRVSQPTFRRWFLLCLLVLGFELLLRPLYR